MIYGRLHDPSAYGRPQPGRQVRALLAVLSAVAGLLTPLPTAEADGERLFRQRCASCHAVEPGRNKAGPHLAGIVGRPAASVDGARYSKAMQSAAITWDWQLLDTFLAAPSRMVPGTRMTVRVPDSAHRTAIIG
ncbi:c-type cytochrome [Sinorhizobium meliloti]|uniref:c-type cytochrome n=1 Tax=Rhizobium meliloti TaxID=382 RepID=UPI003F17016D